jgi:hypothetical protein
MAVEAQELIEQLRMIDRSVDPDDEAARLLLGSTDWFEGLMPSTAWVLSWLDSVGVRDAMQSALRLAVRGGYRHGRRLLGTEASPHPDIGQEERCDDQADALCAVSFEIATGDIFDQLPPVVIDVHRSLATLVASVKPLNDSALSDHERARICLFGANIAFVVAMVEQRFVTLNA